MTMTEIFDAINRYQSYMDSTVNRLAGPESALIVSLLEEALAYARAAFYYTEGNIWTEAMYLRVALWNLSRATDQLYSNVVSVINANAERLKDTIANYDHHVTDLVQTAIGDVYNEISNLDAISTEYVDDAIAQLDYELSTDIIASESNVRDYVDLVKAELSSTVSELEGEVAETESSLYEALTTKASEIYTAVGGWIDELWDGVTAAYDYVTAKFNEVYTSLSTWFTSELNEAKETLSALINNVWLTLTESVNNLNILLDNAVDYLQGAIDTAEETLTDVIETAKTEIYEVLTGIDQLMDWRFQFLNIFMTYPELSFLQVLTRDDELFQKYKPYWLALLSRLLKEEE